jgi:type IV secretion system protein VirD4
MKYFLALAIFLLLLATFRWCFLPHGRVPRFRVLHIRIRLRLRLHPGRGHATVVQLWLRWGRFAAFRRSGRGRQSMSFAERVIAGSAAYSILIGRAQYRHALRMPLEEHALIMAPPRTGKTGLLADMILRYPGPVLSTTTKHDVFELTSGVRSRTGPVEVFNPQSIGGVPSTFRWNPIGGCESQEVAIRRADGFAKAITMSGVEDSSFWTAKASDYLRGYFHAAALADGDLRLVSRWVMGSDPQDPEEILAASGSDQWALQLAELRSEAQKTASTIRMTMSRSLAFMSDPALALSVLPGQADGFDIADWLVQRGTLYMIAESEHDDSPVAPLFACLANEVHHIAAQLGQASPGGRLDPPLLMALDEIVQTCPVPLPTWLADSGGKGIQLIPVAHGEAQLRSRWHADGAQVVLDTCAVKVWLSGISDTKTLEMASKLCGQVAMKERGHDQHGRHDVMTPDMIRQLPASHALVIRGGLSPVIAKLPAAWKDPVYRNAQRHGQAIAQLAAAPPIAVPQPDAGRAVASHQVPRTDPAAPAAAVPGMFEPDFEPATSPVSELVHSDNGAYPWR